jgi:alanyl-tRNA synthetase
LHQLIPTIALQFKNVFPELFQQQDFVANVILEEEKSFLRTLESGLKRIDVLMKDSYDKNIAGKDAFELYDTYGFPLDLTKLIASDDQFSVDEAGFNAEMLQQKTRSRKAAATETGDWMILSESNSVKFVGYTDFTTEANVLKYRKVKQKDKELYQVVLDVTPFYAESGGQIGDTGLLNFNGELIKVLDTKKENDLIIHFTEELPEDVSSKVVASIHQQNRMDISAHHSVTHLIHAALRKVLGSHVQQKGSLVTPHYMRFDFAHFSKVTDEQIREVEAIVNQKIRQSIEVSIKSVAKEDAMKLGAMALFGEKYGDIVRVVTMSEDYSIELCGGTHVPQTGTIGLCKIISESAVAAGVRRIEVVTGKYAELYVDEKLSVLDELGALLKNPKQVTAAVKNLVDENAGLKKELEKAIFEKAATLKNELKSKIVTVNGANIIIEKIDLANVEAIKKIAFDLKNETGNLCLIIGAEIMGKAHITVMLSDALAQEKGWNAKKFIQSIAAEIKGGGGGQDFYATAGGTNVDGIMDALAKLKQLVA